MAEKNSESRRWVGSSGKSDRPGAPHLPETGGSETDVGQKTPSKSTPHRSPLSTDEYELLKSRARRQKPPDTSIAHEDPSVGGNKKD